MSVQLELERTFLAKYMPVQIDGARSEIIVDTYIPGEADHASLRLRKRGELYELTKKEPTAGDDSSQQTEHTVPLTADEYDVLKQISKKSMTKRRFYSAFYGHAAEIDVYMDGLEGLVVIDFEFDSVEAMQAFEPPEVCLAEVTQEAFIAGGKLAGKTLGDIDYELGQLKYQALYMDKEEQSE